MKKAFIAFLAMLLFATCAKTGGRFESIFRLYGPDKLFFEKTWILPDIEEVK